MGHGEVSNRPEPVEGRPSEVEASRTMTGGTNPPRRGKLWNMQRAAALRLLGGGLVTATFGGCAAVDCSIPPPAGKAPTRFGTQVYAQDDVERAIGLFAACGGSMLRVQINGNFNFADALFAAAAAQGMRIVILTDFSHQPVDVEAFVKAQVALQQRYAKYDPVWEIWNEPNLAYYWGALPNVEEYTSVAVPTAKALRAAGARDVWSGGTSGIDLGWIRRLTQLGVFDVMNGCAVHSYDDPCIAYGQYRSVMQIVPKDVPIHTTETCIPSTQDQASFLRNMWYIHGTLGLQTMIWCELRDGTAGTDGAYAFPYGLLYANYAPKPSYFIAKQLT